MEVNFNKIDDLNATLTVALSKTDYTEKIDKELKKHQKTVAIKGFRVGTAPLGMIKSMYGKGILAEEINRLASRGLYDYLKENNIDILAQPIESENVKSVVDIENGENFLFAFDLGLAPTFELNISEKDTLDKYIIAIDDSEVDKEIEQLAVRNGDTENVEVAEEKDLIYGTISELNESNEVLEGGILDKTISLTPELITDAATKNLLIGVTKGSILTVDIFELFNNNQSVISSSLGIAKEAVNDLFKNFKLTITEITRRKPAAINQELFDKVMGAGIANSEEEFRIKVKENIQNYYQNESEHQIEHMLTHLLSDKHDVKLPDSFLKRWLIASKEKSYNQENIDERYAQESNTLKEVLIREKIAAKYGLKVEMEDIEQASIGYTLSMFRNYGLQNPDFEFVKKFSDDSLKKEEHVQQMNDIAVRRKVYDKLKEIITYKEIPISIEDFYKAIQAHNEEHKH
ncbi:MAG: trigger factor [Bacteroidetes bacterium]|nr:trigger factor [Bacteroidota bacterium]